MIIRIHNFVTDIKLFSIQLNLIHLLLTTKLICIFYVVTTRSGQLSAITVKAEIAIFLTRDWARTNHFVRLVNHKKICKTINSVFKLFDNIFFRSF